MPVGDAERHVCGLRMSDPPPAAVPLAFPSITRDDLLQLCHSCSYSVWPAYKPLYDGNMKYLHNFYGKPTSKEKHRVEVKVQY
jgi:hypothetical protein